MKSGKWTSLIPLTLLAALAISHSVSAQDTSIQTNKPKHHTYKLIDLGTLGGPSSTPASPSSVTVNSGGIGIALADSSIPDPYAPYCLGQDCFVAHAAEWHNGHLTDLGALPGVNTSFPFGINDPGEIIGISENGLIDPLTGSPEIAAVYWKNGEIIDLGTFGGNASYANSINNEGQIVGMALNAIPDSYSSGIGSPVFVSAFPVATQFRAFLWTRGVMHDLGTLGGNDAQAFFVNESGQVAGASYTNTVANPVTGLPTQDPFFWEDGKMVDVGTLGGTIGVPRGLNNRGQVVGSSNLVGDRVFHAFLWDKKEGLRDIGSLGGNSWAAWVNESGEVAGGSYLTGDQLSHPFFWKEGVMTDLGTVAGEAFCYPLSIGSQGQVVGESYSIPGQGGPGWLWESGGPIVDLNQLVLPGSNLTVVSASYVNDRGEIAGEGLLPDGNLHAILLIPHGYCDDACEARIAASQNNTPTAHVSSMSNISMPARRGQLAPRFHALGQGPNN